MVDAAKLFGKASREVRRMIDDLPTFSLDEEAPQPPKPTPPTITKVDPEVAGEEVVVEPGPISFQRDDGSEKDPSETRPS